MDFSDASAPAARFTADELEAFTAAEKSVHDVLQAIGLGRRKTSDDPGAERPASARWCR